MLLTINKLRNEYIRIWEKKKIKEIAGANLKFNMKLSHFEGKKWEKSLDMVLAIIHFNIENNINITYFITEIFFINIKYFFI